jgi:hypothetical protein
MIDNLVIQLENNLRERPMKTMDPNTQRAGDEKQKSPKELYQRATIATALASILEFSRKDQHIKKLISDNKDMDYATLIFHNQFEQLALKINEYSGYHPENFKEDFNFVFGEIIKIVRHMFGIDAMAAKDYISNQRADILSYLPGELQTGKFLHNTTIDDNTNKMHGPFSDFTHWLGQLFSTADQ